MPRLRFMRHSAAVVAALAGATVVAVGQQPPQFRTRVDVVQLDVSVLDQNGLPIKGLAPADFTVLENGEPRPIVGFREFDIPEPEVPSARWMRDVAPDVRSNQIDDARLFVLLLDDAIMVNSVRMVQDVKRIANQIIDRMQPSDLAAVVFTRDNRHAQDFTNDRGRLRAAVDRFSVGFYRSGGSDMLWHTYSVTAAARVAELLGSIPGRRKALIYVSLGVPMSADAIASTTTLGLGSDGGGSRDLLAGLTDRERGLAGSLQSLLRGSQLSNVNIYTIDPGGLDGLAGYLALRNRNPLQSLQSARQHTDYLETVAAMSGGEAIVRVNDFVPGIERIFRANSAYYFLGYESAAAAAGRRVKLDVRVSRPGARVQARTAWIDAPRVVLEAPPDMSVRLDAALASPLPDAGIPLEVAAAPIANPAGGDPVVALVIGARQPATPGSTRTIEVLARAFSVEGEPRGADRRAIRLRVDPDAQGFARYDVLGRLALAPGRHSLRISVVDAVSRTQGSVYTDVTVPDFAREALSLSGLFVDASPAPPAGPADLLDDLASGVRPTTARSFGAADRATVFVRACQGGRRGPGPVTASMTITDTDDRPVVAESLTVPADAFGPGRFADVRYRLPIADLSPGAYLLTMEFSLGRARATRHLRFERRN